MRFLTNPDNQKRKEGKEEGVENCDFFHLSKDFLRHILITLCNPYTPLGLRERVSCYLLSQRMKEDGGRGEGGRVGGGEKRRGSYCGEEN